MSHEIAEVRNIRGLERTYFQANLERKVQLVALNLVDATGRLYSVKQDIRILSFVAQENQVTGSRIPELQNRKFIFQNQDMSAFTKVIQSIEKAHHTTKGTNENPRTSEKSAKSSVLKGNRIDYH